MTEEKQIDEMCDIVYQAMIYGCSPRCSCVSCRRMDKEIYCNECAIAHELYNAGYRKQSEGEWVDEPHFAQRGMKGKYYVCSKCNVCVPKIEELPLYLWHYCPHCGAKMKGEGK